MGFERTLPHDRGYWLIRVNEAGIEQKDPDGTLASQLASARIETERPTDVFIMSHGWKGDVPGAREQFEAWMGLLLADAPNDRRPLLVGFHWPSLPFGDEKLEQTFALNVDARGQFDLDAMADEWMATTQAPEVVRADLLEVLRRAEADSAPEVLAPELAVLLTRIQQGLGIAAEDADLAPGADERKLALEAAYQTIREDGSYGLFSGNAGPLVGLLRQFSFWSMKKRARDVGSNGGAAVLRELARAAAKVGARVHLFGHSFGCLVVSAMLKSATEAGLASVHSVFLVQGALSAWAYCAAHPSLGRPGLFADLVRDKHVQGPIVATKSEFDRAVRVLFPAASQLAGLDSYGTTSAAAKLIAASKYGAVGAFGVLGVDAQELGNLGPVPAPPAFVAGRVYNIDAHDIICNGDGIAGAHSDLIHPELFQAVWHAATA